MTDIISTVKEQCLCGATFEYQGHATEVLLALARFQEAHKICRTEEAIQKAVR